MRYFLVDYEAVQNLDGIENLTETDVVILLFMDDTKGVSFRTLAKMNQSKAKIQQKFIANNSTIHTHFAICFLVGRISAQKNSQIVVISEAIDFLHFLNAFAKTENVQFFSYESIEKALKDIPENKTRNEEKEQKEEKKTENVGGIGYSFTEEEEMAIQKVFRLIGFIEESHEQVFREIFWTATHQPFMLHERLIEISKNINYSQATLNIYVEWYRNELKSCSDSN